jgi:hypothetical protein
MSYFAVTITEDEIEKAKALINGLHPIKDVKCIELFPMINGYYNKLKSFAPRQGFKVQDETDQSSGRQTAALPGKLAGKMGSSQVLKSVF